MRKNLTADRAVATAMLSINADAKATEARIAMDGANRLANDMMARVRAQAPVVKAIQAALATQRAAAFAATPRGQRLLAARG
jgi:hypothetical protein